MNEPLDQDHQNSAPRSEVLSERMEPNNNHVGNEDNELYNTHGPNTNRFDDSINRSTFFLLQTPNLILLLLHNLNLILKEF